MGCCEQLSFFQYEIRSVSQLLPMCMMMMTLMIMIISQCLFETQCIFRLHSTEDKQSQVVGVHRLMTMINCNIYVITAEKVANSETSQLTRVCFDSLHYRLLRNTFSL